MAGRRRQRRLGVEKWGNEVSSLLEIAPTPPFLSLNRRIGPKSLPQAVAPVRGRHRAGSPLSPRPCEVAGALPAVTLRPISTTGERGLDPSICRLGSRASPIPPPPPSICPIPGGQGRLQMEDSLPGEEEGSPGSATSEERLREAGRRRARRGLHYRCQQLRHEYILLLWHHISCNVKRRTTTADFWSCTTYCFHGNLSLEVDKNQPSFGERLFLCDGWVCSCNWTTVMVFLEAIFAATVSIKSFNIR